MPKLNNNKKNKYKYKNNNVENINNNVENINNNPDKIENNSTTNNNQIFISQTKNNNKNIFDENNKLFNLDCDFSEVKIDNNIEGKKMVNKNNIKSSSSINSPKKSRSRSCSSSSSNNIDKKYIDDKNIFFSELLKKQITGIPLDKKLSYNDIKRISKFIKSSVFDKKKCSIWNGYITNENNNSKGTYINFYFNKKKIALHRLLYINYIGVLSDNEYLKFSCENKGKCCNINHLKKYSYNNINKTSINENDENKNKPYNNNESIKINMEKKKLIVEI